MEKLKAELDVLIKKLENESGFRAALDEIVSVYPFNEYEYIISTLLAHKKLSYNQYLNIRDDYINRNRYLYLFEMAPRTFGDTWGLAHVCSIDSAFKRPSKEVDEDYNGEYDLYLDYKDEKGKSHYVKIEVKASRANNRGSSEPLVAKASSYESRKPFLMNFQQQKPRCCDVFIWIAVYRDQIKYWVLSSDFVQRNKYFTPQHRDQETASRIGNYKKEDIYEGQIMITNENVDEFDEFLQEGSNLRKAVVNQYVIQNKLKEKRLKRKKG